MCLTYTALVLFPAQPGFRYYVEVAANLTCYPVNYRLKSRVAPHPRGLSKTNLASLQPCAALH